MEASQVDLTVHKGAISQVMFNRGGDLLLSSSMDSLVSLWNLEGNLLGTYSGHTGAVWTIDVLEGDLVSGGGDAKIVVYDLETGREKGHRFAETKISSARFCDREKIFFTTDNSLYKTPKVQLYDVRAGVSEVLTHSSVPTSICSFGDLMVFSDNLGFLNVFDIRKNEVVASKKIHDEKINELKPSFCGTFFTTSSDDKKSKIVDFDLNVVKTFVSEDPINSACVFRLNDKMVTAGGVSARDVTLTEGNARFDVKFHDIITTQVVGSYSPHFGTINSVDVHPRGDRMISGGEDGIVCITTFGEDFYEAEFTEIGEEIKAK